MREGCAWRSRAVLASMAALSIFPCVLPAQAGPNSRTLSFVVSRMAVPAVEESGVCQPLSGGGLEAFEQTLTPEERHQYPRTELRRLQNLMAERWGFRYAKVTPAIPDFDVQLRRAGSEAGLPAELRSRVEALRREAGAPPGKGTINNAGRQFSYESCTEPHDFPQAAVGYRPYNGRLAIGINLDNKTGPHDFTSPEGVKGVDNQLWHAIGCTKIFRELGSNDYSPADFSLAQRPNLIEITGVDDPRNDPEVEVRVYLSATPGALDKRGNALGKASYDPLPDAGMSSSVRGRIVDGSLITEPFDVVLGAKSQIIDAVRRLREARLEAKLGEDGTISGGFFGYYLIDSFWEYARQFTQNGADQTQFSCPGVRSALERFADGIRDPQSGRYTGISTTVIFSGVPAFVYHAEDAAGPAGKGVAR